MVDNNIIVSRIQHRRGLKQDLPQPLRPGEIGLATDSRQVYIGGDPSDPQSAPFNAVSYFENTVGAQEHTESIVANQIIAFTVPFIKYARGSYNNMSTIKYWQPADARSITNAITQPRCRYTSSDFDVFSQLSTDQIQTSLTRDADNSSVLFVDGNALSSDPTGDIRIGDLVQGTGIIGSDVMVLSVEPKNASNEIEITVSSAQSLINGANVTIVPRSIYNYNHYQPVTNGTANSVNTSFSRAAFKNTDVSVHKNGIQLSADVDNTHVAVPSPAYDYTLDATQTASNAQHTLTLRTAPNVNDEVTVCYYSNANVIAAIQGIEATGKIAPGIDRLSFYAEYNIPSWRHIPPELIRVNETTGVGYIGLQQRHIANHIDGSTISDPNNLTLGNLMVARLDDQRAVSSVTVTNATSTTLPTVEIAFELSQQADVFSNALEEAGNVDLTYRFNRALVRHQSGAVHYIHDNVFDVTNAGSTGRISITVNATEYNISRPASATLTAGSSYGSNAVITVNSTSADGISTSDWVRIVDATGDPANCELHGTIFRVLSVSEDSFLIENSELNVHPANVVPNFTADISNVFFVNHGSDQNNVNSTYQLYSVNHGLTENEVEVYAKSSVGSALLTDNTYPVQLRASEHNTFFVLDATVASDVQLGGISGGPRGTYVPELSSSIPATFAVTPVLSINLSGNTTVAQAIGTVNKPLVTTTATGEPEQIFPYMDYTPDGSLDTLYITQRPSYSSVDAGGLDFALFEDTVTPTLSQLGFQPGEYLRVDSTVKSKLESWMHDLAISRDVNLFTSVLVANSYAGIPYSDLFKRFELTIDESFNEVLFCDRQEAANFNYIVNSAYSESVFDRSEDSQNGTRGLVNLKNNLEIQTREASTVGEKVTTFVALENNTILQSVQPGDEVFRIPAAVYDSFFLEYTISEQAGLEDKYNRIGTMQITCRPDFDDAESAVVIMDQFSSQWQVTHSAPIVEPKFGAKYVDGAVVVYMEPQYRDPENPNLGDIVTHTIGSTLVLSYIYQRWSSR